MINYILLIGVVIVLAIVVPIVIKLAKQERGFLAIVLVVFTVILCSTAVWFTLNESAESRPPSVDSTAAASTQHIQGLERDEAKVDAAEKPGYSETNEKQNREAVERFKELPPAE